MQKALHRVLVLGGGAIAIALLSSCGTSTKVETVTGDTPVAEAKAAASGREPEAEPPRESVAHNINAYKVDAARRVYFRNTALLYDGLPPPILKSVVVLTISLDAKGMPKRVAVLRSNGYRDLEQRAIKSVHDAAPLPIPHEAILKRGSVDYVETWLFRDDGRFQIRSLAEPQATVE